MAQNRLKRLMAAASAEVSRVFQRAGPVAAGAYLIVVIFGVSFVLVRRYWPTMQDATVTTVALLVAAPLALALVWHS
jgi:hypothetical protein